MTRFIQCFINTIYRPIRAAHTIWMNDGSIIPYISAGKAQSSYIFNLAISSTSNYVFAFMLSYESKRIFIFF